MRNIFRGGYGRDSSLELSNEFLSSRHAGRFSVMILLKRYLLLRYVGKRSSSTNCAGFQTVIAFVGDLLGLPWTATESSPVLMHVCFILMHMLTHVM